MLTRLPRRSHLIALFYGLLVAFFWHYLRNVDWATILRSTIVLQYVLLALPFSLASRFLQPLAWSVLIRAYGDDPPHYRDLTLIYAKSWLGRYIPGKVAWIGGKILFGSQFKMRRGVLGITSVLEAGIQLLSALALALLFFTISGPTAELPIQIHGLAIAALIVLVVSLSPPIFNVLVSVAHQRFKQRPLPAELHLPARSVVLSAGLYSCIHVLGAFALFFLVKAIKPAIGIEHLPFLAAAFLMAGAIGTLAFFAPSGIGVREGVLIILLVEILPREEALIAVVLVRLWSIVMDLAFWLLSSALVKLPATTSRTRVSEDVGPRSG